MMTYGDVRLEDLRQSECNTPIEPIGRIRPIPTRLALPRGTKPSVAAERTQRHSA